MNKEKIKEVKVACPLVKTAYEKNGKIIAWKLDKKKFLKMVCDSK